MLGEDTPGMQNNVGDEGTEGRACSEVSEPEGDVGDHAGGEVEVEVPGGHEAPLNEDLFVDETLPGQDGSTAQPSFQFRKYVLPASLNGQAPFAVKGRQVLKQLLLNLSMVKARNPGISEQAMEDILAAVRGIELLPQEFSQAIPGNYRSMMAALEKVFKVPVRSTKYVYHACQSCMHVFRKESKDLDACPSCGEPRYDEKGKPMKKV